LFRELRSDVTSFL